MNFLNELIPQDYPNFSEFGPTPCSESDPETFFSEDAPEGNRSSRGTYRFEKEAKTICSTCPYKLRCLEYALRNPELTGIWGGTTEVDRAVLKRRITIRHKSRSRTVS